MRSSLRDTVNKSAGLYAPGGSLPGAWGPAVACLMTLLLAGAVCAQTTDSEKHLAAESFLHSAVGMTVAPSETPARAGRMWALARFADRLAPGDGRTNRLLADIYLGNIKKWKD